MRSLSIKKKKYEILIIFQQNYSTSRKTMSVYVPTYDYAKLIEIFLVNSTLKLIEHTSTIIVQEVKISIRKLALEHVLN